MLVIFGSGLVNIWLQFCYRIFCQFILLAQMKEPSQYLTQRDSNRHFRQVSHIAGGRVRKQNSIIPINPHQPTSHSNKKYIYDQERMNQMIKTLKQQNNHLKNIIKMQQTQLTYYSQQEKQQLKVNLSNISYEGNNMNNGLNGRKKMELQNYRLRKEVKRLEQQNEKIKKSVKNTNMKQLQTTISVYEEQIKNITAKLYAYEKSTYNVEELNKIIQQNYFAELKNKELETLIEEKNQDMEHLGRIIRKLKNIIVQKNNQIENSKQDKEKVDGTNRKGSADQYVHKSQLNAKKKQISIMAQNIQRLQSKIQELQVITKALAQENSQITNKQSLKRKQLLAEFQKLKKSHQILQQRLNQIRKSESLPAVILKISQIDLQSKRQKSPLIVSFDHIKVPLECLIYNLQSNMVHHEAALDLIMNCDHRLKLESGETLTQQYLREEKINIRQVISCLELPPMNMQILQQKQLIARYMVESEADSQNPYIDYDGVVVNISYAKSIFRRILHEYPIFKEIEIIEHCAYIEDFARRNQPFIKAALAKMVAESKPPSSVSSSNTLLKNSSDLIQSKELRKPSYKCGDITEVIIKENEMNEITIQFMKFWTYKCKENYFTFNQFIQLFKTEGVCTFITEDPSQDKIPIKSTRKIGEIEPDKQPEENNE